MYGVRGDPKRSEDRHINKIFDYKRQKQREVGGCRGCDLDFQQRDRHMSIGHIPRGGLNMLREEVAQVTQMDLNKDPNSKTEMIIR